MLGFLFGIMFFYNILSTYIFYRIIRKIKLSKVTFDDIENYLLENFLEVDVDV